MKQRKRIFSTLVVLIFLAAGVFAPIYGASKWAQDNLNSKLLGGVIADRAGQYFGLSPKVTGYLADGINTGITTGLAFVPVAGPALAVGYQSAIAATNFAQGNTAAGIAGVLEAGVTGLTYGAAAPVTKLAHELAKPLIKETGIKILDATQKVVVPKLMEKAITSGLEVPAAVLHHVGEKNQEAQKGKGSEKGPGEEAPKAQGEGVPSLSGDTVKPKDETAPSGDLGVGAKTEEPPLETQTTVAQEPQDNGEKSPPGQEQVNEAPGANSQATAETGSEPNVSGLGPEQAMTGANAEPETSAETPSPSASAENQENPSPPEGENQGTPNQEPNQEPEQEPGQESATQQTTTGEANNPPPPTQENETPSENSQPEAQPEATPVQEESQPEPVQEESAPPADTSEAE